MRYKDRKDCWDKFQILANCLVPIAIGLVGWWINSTLKIREAGLKNREINLKFVEVAVGVLRSKPDEASGELRDWAVDIVNEYSEVKLSQKAREILKTNSLPIVNFLASEDGKIITTEDGKPIQLN